MIRHSLDTDGDLQAADVDALSLVIKRLLQIQASRKDVETAPTASSLLREELLDQPPRTARLVAVLQTSIDSLDAKLYHRGLELLQVTSALAKPAQGDDVAISIMRHVVTKNLEEDLRRGRHVKRKSDLMILGELVKVAPGLLTEATRQLLLESMVRSLKLVESTALRTKIILGVLDFPTSATEADKMTRLQPFLQDTKDALTVQALSRSVLPKILSMAAAKTTLSMLEGPQHLVSWLSVAAVCASKSIVRVSELDQQQLKLAMAHLDDSIRLAAFETMVTCAAVSQQLEDFGTILDWFDSNMRVYNGS